MAKIETWHEYYTHAQLDPSAVREGCEPRYISNGAQASNTIILVHGLTDSPFFMEDIGRYFQEQMGFNVYIPLLAGHGLKEPRGMQEVSLQRWIADVGFALDWAHAAHANSTISIGGLSTGGALSIHRALHLPDRITGAIFLFSAALDLASKYGDLHGDLTEFLLRLDPLAYVTGIVEDQKPLIGRHPYRYARRDIHGAAQLAALIGELDKCLATARLAQPLFAAHSVADQTADIEGIQKLIQCCTASEFFCIGKEYNVPHASVVLQEDLITSNGFLLEPKNPLFSKMMQAVHCFARQHLQNVQG